ncbi:MAG: Dityrosine transporter 1 [Caeruleum heppii]|nr:MAG: Dityrosine transporter 1 [Caeruleum heppii]
MSKSDQPPQPSGPFQQLKDVEKAPDPSPKTDGPAKPPYSAYSKKQRNFILFIVTVAGFFGPLSGGIYLPALQVLAKDFRVSDNLINVTVSVFMFVLAIGPLLWAGMADFSGRKPLYVISFAIFIMANLVLALSPTLYGILIVFRIIQAFGACSVASLGAGTVADIIEPKNRASAMSIFFLGPQMGPILGPALGGLFAGKTSWRWIFGYLGMSYSHRSAVSGLTFDSAISSVVVWTLILFCLPETLRSRVGNGSMFSGKPWYEYPTFRSEFAKEGRGPKTPKPSPRNFYRLFRYPPIGITSVNTSLLFGSYYCVAISQPKVFTERYNFSTTEVGLTYLAAGFAMVVGSLIGGRFSDWNRAKAVKTSPEGKVDPEKRLADQIWGVLICGLGTLLYGWLCQFNIHPAVVIVATSLCKSSPLIMSPNTHANGRPTAGFGMTWVLVTSSSFMTEVAPGQAATVFALGGLLRNPSAALGAIVIQPLIDRMGIGWCFTGLGLIDIFFVGGAVVLLRIRSPYWRRQRDAKLKAAAAAAAAAK